MISGIEGGAGLAGFFSRTGRPQEGPPRPDFGKIDGDGSNGLSRAELRQALGEGAFGRVGEADGGRGPGEGREARGDGPPPPPKGGAQGSTEGSIAAQVLQTILELLGSEEAEDTQSADTLINALFDVMDSDGDSSVSATEFASFGEAVRGGSAIAAGRFDLALSAYGVTSQIGEQSLAGSPFSASL